MSAVDFVYVRLKPFNPKLGHVVRRYSVGGETYVHDEGTDRAVWYKVSAKKAALLSEKRQQHDNLMSPLLFDIVTPEEWKEISVRENDLRLVELGLVSATNIVPQAPTPVDRTLKQRSAAAAAAFAEEPAKVPVPTAPPAPVTRLAEPEEPVAPPAPVLGGRAAAVPAPEAPVVSESSDDDDDFVAAPRSSRKSKK